MGTETALRDIISQILFLKPKGRPAVRKIVAGVCKKYHLSCYPKNSEIFAAATDEEKDLLRNILLVKPSRTLSGVAPVAVMTSPSPCPHGICLPCPGGPNHPFNSPQSYTGGEPAARRAILHNYDPYDQVSARLKQFEALGHHVDKAELIVMGGTMTAREKSYQQSFVSECIRAMNEYGGNTPVGDVFTANETSHVRCIAITFETRPDWCKEDHIKEMLNLGVTKVEIGVQHLDNRILLRNRRGCTVEDVVKANTLLRNAGIKVGFHMMPNLPGSTIEADKAMFKTLFEDERFKPDFLKIYPTLVTPGTEIEDLLNKGEYQTYDESELIDLVAYAKENIPEYCRLSRIQRDIPADKIVSGSPHSNFRELVQKRLAERGGICHCIRCREIGRVKDETSHDKMNNTDKIDNTDEIKMLSYDCCNGKEFFISAVSGNALTGFTRMRYPGETDYWVENTEDSAFIRELHVYGMMVPIGKEGSGNNKQHQHYGRKLLKIAEEKAEDDGYRRISIMAGIGVRPYYRRLGYERCGPYMTKQI